MDDEKQFLDAITECVKVERKTRKISQLKLSNILGHNSTSYVARIELHQGSYNLNHLYKIAQEFQIEVKDLIPNIQKSSSSS